jgi:hypothetical protein
MEKPSFDDLVDELYDESRFQLIEEKPSFDDLVEIHQKITDCNQALSSLNDGRDTLQRACDLLVTAENLRDAIRDLVLVAKEE